jgi:hypothetical protein
LFKKFTGLTPSQFKKERLKQWCFLLINHRLTDFTDLNSLKFFVVFVYTVVKFQLFTLHFKKWRISNIK